MVYSMTGFGRGIAESEDKRFIVEIKSLNSKQLDLASRVPAQYRSLDPEIRNIIAARLERGKVDLNCYVESLVATTDATVNTQRLAVYKKQIQQMARELDIPEPDDWYSVLMRFPDALHTEISTEIPDSDHKALTEALTKAIDMLDEFRAEEGKKLDTFFRIRIERIASLLAMVPQYETERLVKIRSRILEALEKIPQADYDRGRFEQEMIFYIEKLDINEEKQRLTQHLNYFKETLGQNRGQGKKLGFIAQEMGREINTLGSKSNHAEMQILVVKMKDELEQIKEQVLNAL